jgi:serine-type D-Ala-D-Ala carboxypeptidase
MMHLRVQRSVESVLVRYVGEQAGALTAGAAVIVGWGGQTLVRAGRGFAQLRDCGRVVQRPLHLDTRFDLASITKALTTSAVMRLVGDGRLATTTRAEELLPGFQGDGKDEITVAHLLGHEAGLPPWAPVYLHARDAASALEWVVAQPLAAPPGRVHAYSDLGFMLLGGILEAATGQRLSQVLRHEVVEPLGLDATGYRPSAAAQDEASGVEAGTDRRGGFAATSCGDAYERRMIATGEPYPVEGDPDDFDGWRAHTLVGEANDGNAWHAFGGVAGHAGAFATVDDVATLGRTLLAGVLGEDNPLAPSPVLARFCAPLHRSREHTPEGEHWDRQALGWWRDPGDAKAGGRLVGHSGFTGGRLAIDPSRDCVLVLLANRQQIGPPEPDITPLWRGLVAALPDRPPG